MWLGPACCPDPGPCCPRGDRVPRGCEGGARPRAGWRAAAHCSAWTETCRPCVGVRDPLSSFVEGRSSPCPLGAPGPSCNFSIRLGLGTPEGRLSPHPGCAAGLGWCWLNPSKRPVDGVGAVLPRACPEPRPAPWEATVPGDALRGHRREVPIWPVGHRLCELCPRVSSGCPGSPWSFVASAWLSSPASLAKAPRASGLGAVRPQESRATICPALWRGEVASGPCPGLCLLLVVPGRLPLVLEVA